MTKQAKRGAKANKSARKKKARDNNCAIDLDNIDDSDIGSFFDSDSECEMLERTVKKKRKKATGKKPSVACQGMQQSGIPCGNKARDGTQFCRVHQPKATKTKAPPAAMKTQAPPSATKTKAPPAATKTKAPPAATKTQAPPPATKTQARPPATTTEVESPICLARMPVFGLRCNMTRFGESRFCIVHWPMWHLKDSPIWGLPPATTVPVSDPTICLAWVASTGLRCGNKRYGPSRWCGEHFNDWHGQDSPAWRPCPS
ncbi:unnamed protein product [Ectocarpus sp. 4 AP-2014]